MRTMRSGCFCHVNDPVSRVTVAMPVRGGSGGYRIVNPTVLSQPSEIVFVAASI